MFSPIAVPQPAGVRRRVSAGLAALAGHAALIATAVYATAAATPPDHSALDVGPIVYVPAASPDREAGAVVSLSVPVAPVPWIDVPVGIPVGLPPLDRVPRFDVLGYGGPAQGEGGGGGDSAGPPVLSYTVVEQPPEPLAGPPLEYPAALRRAGIEGRAVVEAVIDTAGRPEPGTLRVVHSSHPGFDAAALRYVREALYRPGRVGGRAVRVLVRQPIEFRLR